MTLAYYKRPRDEAGREGLWVFAADGRGDFYHGDRDEMQAPRFLPSDLDAGALGAVRITEAEALSVLSGWPEAQANLRRCILRDALNDCWLGLRP